MSNYIIYTDSGCDIPTAMLAEWGVQCRNLTFRFTDSETEYSNDEMSIETFYDKMKEGGIAKTAAINSETFAADFEKILVQGYDVLYLGFSSGLSTTFNSARLAAESVREKYPERRVEIFDTLAASAGQGLMIYLTAMEQKKGATLDEAIAFVSDLKPRMGIWFTVDDLVYLKRGGRVSATSAFVGNLLGIKPVLYMDGEGHLIPRAKVRGRKSAITALVDQYTAHAVDKENGTVFLSHGACRADAEQLAAILKERHGVTVKLIADIGPVIGAHSGPGTLAIFFVADAR